MVSDRISIRAIVDEIGHTHRAVTDAVRELKLTVSTKPLSNGRTARYVSRGDVPAIKAEIERRAHALRDRPAWINPKASAQALRGAMAPRTRERRPWGHGDPTTAERDYTHDEMEFMLAMHDYKVRTGHSFPSCREILGVVRALGYTKAESAQVDDDTAPGAGT